MAKTKKKKKIGSFKLTAKQAKFCNEYLIDLNATQAAIRSGYSRKTARKIANENLTKPDIRARIAELQAELQKGSVTPQMVIDEFAKVGFSNIQDFIDENNEITDISQLNREIAAAVESIQVDIRHDGGKSKGYTEKIKLKLYNKLHALENISKHLGLYAANNNQLGEAMVNVLAPLIKRSTIDGK